ncbi:purpurin-like [Haliotis rubra]|uniref:purpurin-like n=1 Tax=Haliotis rubra TaxID=36100 RepID=UPI001EE5D03F|nr:purpurin-like [Haliotis rubra]XP_046579213.1 purpurin-like [Haliotis rubra]XP_046579214.1 purpurin-like [Haliotis rubra]
MLTRPGRTETGYVAVYFVIWVTIVDGCLRSSSLVDRGSGCKVSCIPTQSGFDSARLEGLWYAIGMNRFWVHSLPKSTQISSTTDVTVRYKILKDGHLEIKTSAALFGVVCTSNMATGRQGDDSHPGRFTVTFNSQIGRLLGDRAYWILTTDYVNYLVVYSCWKILGDGSCNIHDTYVWVLSREPKPLNKPFQSLVDSHVEKVCVTKHEILKVPFANKCK